MEQLYLLYRKFQARFSAVYFVQNALCWFVLSVVNYTAIPVTLLGLIVVNVGLLALLVASTSTFGKIKPIELLTPDSDFVNNDKAWTVKNVVMIAPLFGFVSLYIYAAVLGLAALAYVPDVFALVSRYTTRHAKRDHALETLTQYKPVVCAYVSGTAQSAYQINMWLDILEKLPHQTIILTTDRRIYTMMQTTSLPVVYASKTDDIFNVFETGIKCILYPANGQKNAVAFRYNQATHCFINHGESDKGVNSSKLLLAYDKLFLAGQMSLDRMLSAGLPVRNAQVTFVGRPQQELNLQKRTRPEIKTILYAPTWEGFVESEDYTSVDTLGLAAIRTLHQTGKYDIVFRPHPFTGRRRKEAQQALQQTTQFCAANGIRISTNEDETIYQAMNDCDVMMSDISSVLVDFLFTEKPVILCKGIEPDEERLADMPSVRAAYRLDDSRDVAKLLEAIEHDDRLREVRQKITRDYIVNAGVGSFDRFAEAVRNCVDD